MGRTVRLLAAVVIGVAATLVVASPAQATQVTYTTVSSWSTGYFGEVTVTNNFAIPITGWEVAFSLPAGETVSSAWTAREAQDTPYYIFINESWNGALAPGDTATFGFIATGTGPPTFLWP